MTGAPSSRVTARNTLHAWLVAGGISGLNVVHKTFPKRINFQEGATAGQMSRAQAVLFIASEEESRLAVGGATNGWKRVDYQFVVQVFHHSVHREAADAMGDFDALIDAIKARLRSDHNFGDPTGILVWQGAEPRITTLYGEPALTESGAVETFAEIRFDVTQMIQA